MPIVIQRSDSRKLRGQLQCRMVNMSSRDTDGLEKSCHEIEVIPGGAEKFLVLGNLVCDELASDDATKKAITNLL